MQSVEVSVQVFSICGEEDTIPSGHLTCMYNDLSLREISGMISLSLIDDRQLSTSRFVRMSLHRRVGFKRRDMAVSSSRLTGE
jgi:hypothetical protein